MYQTARSHIPEDGITVMATEMRVCSVTQFVRDPWLSILPNLISEVIQSSHKADLCINYFQGLGAWGSVVVKALRYKSDGLGIDSRWCHWGRLSL